LLEVSFVRVEAAAALRSSICDWMGDERWRVRFAVTRDDPSPPEPAARLPAAWHVEVATTRAGAELSLELPNDAPTGPRRWSWRVALADGLDDAGNEVVAQALHSTVQAASLTTGSGPTSSSSISASTSSTSDTSDTSSASDTSVVSDSSSASSVPDASRRTPALGHLPVHTGLAYHFYARGAEPVTHGPMLGIELDWLTLPVTFGTFARVAVFTSGHAVANGLDVALAGAALSAGLAVSLPLGDWRPRIALAGGTELLVLDVRTRDPESLGLAGERRPRARSFVATEVGLAKQWGHLELGLVGLLRWQLLASRYEIREGEMLRTIMRPWRLQPGGALVLAYSW
jgi:hypothetical protein